MRWLDNMNENVKRGIRSWLNVLPANPHQIQINEILDFEANAIRNRIWYRGDSNELEQLYRQQDMEYADRYKFWASKCTPGLEMRKIHTGLPGLMVRVLSAIVLADMNDFDFSGGEQQKKLWDEIAKDNGFSKKMEKALKETLYIGDGAFKITVDTKISEYPILEWYSGERVEFVRQRDRIREVIFKTPYKARGKTYVLNERYGFGYIINELYLDGKLVDLKVIAETENAHNWSFDEQVILAVPFQIYESAKYEGRGGSIFDGKLDSFDAFDEAWSQWMDALRAGRAKTYIPECLVPRDPETGQIIRPNPFDNRYFASDNDMSEKAENKVNTDQPDIPHESYLASYCTALDLCLQGIISPSTLGIDVKKLDNADAQREKEKTTLYTRNAIIEAMQDMLPKLVNAAINAYNILNRKALEEVKVDTPFGEYANPSFESQVETLSKARPGVPVMSVEAQVEELYGDSKDETWKKEEIARLKAEQGIAELEEPGISHAAGPFQIKMRGGKQDAGEGDEPDLQDEPEGVPGTSGAGEGAGPYGDIRGGKK